MPSQAGRARAPSQPPSPTLSRKQREQRFRLGLVLDVAEHVFGSEGFHGASVEEIAKRAEFSVGTLYNLFPSKEALFAAVVERRQEEFLAAGRRALEEEPSSLGKLDRLSTFILHYFEAHEMLFRSYVSATSGFMWSVRPTLGEKTYQTHLQFIEFVAGICRTGMAEEQWPRTDPESLALVITATLNAFLTRWVVTEQGTPLEPRVVELQSFIRRIVGVPAAVPEKASRRDNKRRRS